MATESTPERGRGGHVRGQRQRDAAFWLEAELAYVQGTEVDGKPTFPSLRELADRLQVGLRAVEKHAAAHDWTRKREKFLESVARTRARARRQALTERGEVFDSRLLQLLEVLMGQAARYIRDHGTERPLHTADQVRLARALADIMKTGRPLFNLPTGIVETPDDAARREDDVITDAVMAQLDPVERQRFAELNRKVERGEVDLVELYRAAGGVFRAEQQAAALANHTPARRRRASS
jgi:hypothetical protein